MDSKIEQDKFIAILCSTYNGSEYIDELIKSILNQSYLNWKMYIRDDGSIDNSLLKISYWVSLYPLKLILLHDNNGQLGVIKSFESLLIRVDARYYMFCDQDDIWLPTKIEKSINKIQSMENEYNDTPCLVHSDLVLTDSSLNVVSNSFWSYSKINPKHSANFKKLALSNCITGCTIIMNNYAKYVVLPFPEYSMMHDKWCGTVVSNLGKIDWINEPLVLYRQHKKNTVGAKIVNWKYYFNKLLKPYFQFKEYKNSLKIIRHFEPGFSILQFILLKLNIFFVRK